MAHVLNLVIGATTITLNSSSKKVLSYIPKAPNINAQTLQAIMSGRFKGNAPTVTESAKVQITAATADALIVAKDAIEKALTIDAPRRNRTQQGDQVFLTFQPDNGTLAHRSEILEGRVELEEDSFSGPRWGMSRKINLVLAWTRRYFWELSTESQLPLTNANGAAVTTAITIYNHDDGGATDDNWVTIDAANAAGVIPAPVRLEITNTYGTAARRVYVGHKAQGTPASFTHILEAESATLNATYATAGADAACSNGNKVAVVNVPAAVATIFTWAVSATQAGYIKSQWIRPILRFSVLPNNATCSVRLTIKDTTTLAVIYQTEYTTLSTTNYLQPLNEIYLSPELLGQTTAGALSILLDSKDSAATCDWTLDFMQLTPMEAGTGFRLLRPIDETLVNIPATTGVIQDDMIGGATYIESNQGNYQGIGGPIAIIPGVAQRLYFLVDGASDAAIARTITLKAYIRPRKLTI